MIKEMRNKEREIVAQENADQLRSHFSALDPVIFPQLRRFAEDADIGIILGTGWGDVLLKEAIVSGGYSQYSLENELPGFKDLQNMPKIPGHHRVLLFAHLHGKKVVMLRGRIHTNESHDQAKLMPMVRLQVEMLIKLGIKHLILTNAAGSLLPKVKVGDIVAHNGFITLFAPTALMAGEFVSPEDTLKNENNVKIITAAANADLVCHLGAGAMVRGPRFEGRKHDKNILRHLGATVAMMSILPEADIAALYQDPDEEVKVYAMSFITNTAIEEHSHEENQKRAAKSSAKLGALLLNLIDSL